MPVGSFKKSPRTLSLCRGLTTRQPLWTILCRLPQKGIEEIVEEMNEKKRDEETEEIETFPLYPYLLQGYQVLPSCISQYQLDVPVT